MTITVKHKFVSAIPDGADTSVVRPSNWNDDHDLVGTVPVANGGTGATTLTGYLVGNGTSAVTAVTTIPNSAITGLGTISTQNANAVTITGGTINGTTIGLTTAASGAFTYLSTSGSTSTTPTLSFNASNSPIAAGATIANSYLQFVLQNKSGTASASTNYVLSNDLGTDSTYYGEFGMNSSVYSTGTPADFFSLNNGIYFSGHDGDLTIGSGNGYKIYLAWGTTGDKAHVINASGAIGLNTNITGTTNFGTAGYLLTSQGSSSSPTWVNPSTIVGGAGGSNTQVQYNNSGTLAGSANMTFNGTTFTLANDASINGMNIGLGGGNNSSNVAFGAGALNGNTGASVIGIGISTLGSGGNSGNWNTAIGAYAMQFNSTGYSNVALGRFSLQLNTTGYYNVAIAGGNLGGLCFNISGNANTAVGDGTLVRNSIGSGSVAIGSQALTYPTTSVASFTITGGSGYVNGTYNNVPLSYVSGTALSNSGFYPTVNIVVSGGAVTSVTVSSAFLSGGQCFVDTTTVMSCANSYLGGTGSGFSVRPASLYTSQYNTSVGYQAGYNTYSGAANNYYGFQAGLSNVSGGNNNYFGYQAGYNTTGSYNSFFGNGAGSAVTAGSKNVIIGAYTGSAAPISATGSNYIVLSDGDGNVRQTIDSSGNVGIGTTSPTTKLTVTNSDYTFIQLNSTNGTALSCNYGANSALQLAYLGTTTNHGLVFQSNSSEKMRLSAAGGVSIGTATDAGATNLLVAGNITASGNINSTRINPRVLASTANSATPTLNTDSYDMMVITAQSAAITSFTTNLTGTPVNGQKLWIAITGTGAIAITWGAKFESSTVTLPSTTVTTARLDVGFVWNVATSAWRCVAVA